MSDIPEANPNELSPAPPKPGPKYILLKVVLGLAIAATTGALMLPATRRARTSARRSQSKNNMKQLGLALHNYHDTFKQLPVGTVFNPGFGPNARLSWIISILPGIDQGPLYREIDQTKSWNDLANAPYTKQAISPLINPSNNSDPTPEGFAVTQYVGIAGVGKNAANLPVSDQHAGAFGYDRNVRFEDVTDGLSFTMFNAEASGKFGPWSQGGTATIRALITQPYVNGPDGIGSPYVGIVHVLLGDGSVRAIGEKIDPSVFEALATIHGGETIGDF